MKLVYKELLNKKYWKVWWIDIDALIKLKDEYFRLIYKKKLYKWWLYDEQSVISNEIIYNLILGAKEGKWKDILINITRQFWKSFIVYAMVWFVLIFFPKILWIEWYAIGITTNKKDQAKKNYYEVRKYIHKVCSLFHISIDESTKNQLVLWNWAKIVLFSMEASHNEWETLHWIIDDEAQALDYEKFSSEIIPMGLRTGAIATYIGVGWYVKNAFYDKLFDYKNNLIFKLDYNDCVEICKRRYEETGDERHLLYWKWIEKQLQSNELSEAVFKTQYLLEWVLWTWNFITREKLENFKNIKIKEYTPEQAKWNICFAGIDFWKKKDKTVLTIVWIIENKLKILKWFEYDWDMRIQFETIKRDLSLYSVSKVYVDSTWNQDSTVDFLENYIWAWRITRIPFSVTSKDIMYSSLELILQSWKFEYPNNELTNKFEKEMCDLIKEYRADWKMNCHHPDEANGHDDYCDSLALTCRFKVDFKAYNQIFK